MLDQRDEAHLDLAGSRVVTRGDWEQAAQTVLARGGHVGSPDELLARSTVDGLTVPALAGARPAIALPGQPPFTRGARRPPESRGWDIRSAVVDPDATKAAGAVIEDLSNGVTSLWITLGGNGTRLEDLPLVLDEVYFDLAPVIVQASGDVTGIQAAWALADLLPRAGGPHPFCNLGADPIGASVRSATTADLTDLSPIADLAVRLGVRGLVVDATVAHEAGAAEVGELGYSLAVGVAYLRALTAAGMPLEVALDLLEFRYAATADQFVTMAKFRAARTLWYRVAQLSGAAPARAVQAQHGVTSWPMITRYDPWTNLLRGTISAFAAGVGGATAVTVLPFDSALGVPESLGRRLARNTSSLLLSEAGVAIATDPGGGAHAVEALTARLAAAGWAEFQRVEAAGGIVAALSDGSVAGRWASVAAARRQRLNTRRQAVTGVSEFPQPREPRLRRRPLQYPEPAGWAAEFESMRDDPRGTTVFLATLGEVASHTARASFARNAFAAGGIDTAVAGGNTTVSEMLSRYDGSAVVCLAGTDAAYDADGPAAIWALRTNGARWVILAGRPKPELAQLVDDSIAVGDDVVAFLQRTRAQLPDEGGPR
jgi:methylmalonyl-CoA mutase